MTKEKLLERIANFEQIKNQSLANANAANGALVECQFWLSQLETNEGNNDPQPA